MTELRALGASFVMSAFESVSDDVLRRLHKGHSRADLDAALAVLAAARLPVQPTWLPFTPWTTLEDYLDLLQWIRERDLISHVPAVQLSIRLLVPPQSALLDDYPPGYWGGLDAANFAYRWRHPDPRLDELQAKVTVVAETANQSALVAFAAIEQVAYRLAGRSLPARSLNGHRPRLRPTPPRLTEDWFC